MRKFYTLIIISVTIGSIWNAPSMQAQVVSDFENLNLPRDSFWDGSDLSGLNKSTSFTSNFKSGDFVFNNVFDSTFGGPGFWMSGFAYSTKTDSVTSGFGNTYGSRAGGGHDSPTYAVAKNNSTVLFEGAAADTVVDGLFITNSTYAARSMENGDDFAKQFGDSLDAAGNEDGTDGEDWFLLTIKGYLGEDSLTADSVNFYLADYRFPNDSDDYIVTGWEWVDLSSLGNVSGLVFSLSSSDVGSFGMNTPAFFCMDSIASNNSTSAAGDFEELTLGTDTFWNGSDYSGEMNDKRYVGSFASGDAIFGNVFDVTFPPGFWTSGFAYSSKVDSVTPGSGNKYSSIVGSGYESNTYAIGKNNAVVELAEDAAVKTVSGFYVTNTTYAAKSMENGDDFAKQFGSSKDASGNDDGTNGDDWFLLTVKGYAGGNLLSDSVNFYLADYRFEDNTQDYIVKDWTWVEVAALGEVDSLSFTLTSSDVGIFGMNTPAFFAMDDLTTANPSGMEEMASRELALSVYPNPASDRIQFNLKEAVSSFMVLSNEGKVVFSRNNLSAGSYPLDISRMAKGIYHVRISGKKDVQQTTRFIKY